MGRGGGPGSVTVLAFAWAVRTYGIALLDPDNGDRHMLLPAVILLLTMVATLAHAVNRADRRPGGSAGGTAGSRSSPD